MKKETVSLITKSMEIDYALESQKLGKLKPSPHQIGFKNMGLKNTRNLGAS